MVLDLSTLREGPLPYLGWYLEGKAETPARYWWYANEDKGDSHFAICIDARHEPAEWTEKYERAKQVGLQLARGKIFLSTWTHGADYQVTSDIPTQNIPLTEIREAILGGLYRLQEAGFPTDVQIDVDGIATELGVTRERVDRALQYLLEKDLIEEYGTFGRNWSTGDIWLSTQGVDYWEGLQKERVANSTAVPIIASSSEEQLNGKSSTNPKRVAVLHGRNTRLRDDLFNFLRAIGLSPVEFASATRETGEASPYVGKIVERLFESTQAVVVLWSGEDETRLVEAFRSSELDSAARFQPRPNVILEAGMAMALMPDRTVLLQAGSVGEVSDLTGRHTVRITQRDTWRKDLADRLQTAGCDVDLSNSHWLEVGDFDLGQAPKQSVNSALPPSRTESEVERCVYRLQSIPVTIGQDDVTLAQFFRRIGGYVAAGYDDQYSDDLVKALGAPNSWDVEGQITDGFMELLAEDLVTRESVQGGMRRRFRYSLTDLGKQVLKEVRTPS